VFWNILTVFRLGSRQRRVFQTSRMGRDEEDKAFVRDTMKFFEVDKPTFSTR